MANFYPFSGGITSGTAGLKAKTSTPDQDVGIVTETSDATHGTFSAVYVLSSGSAASTASPTILAAADGGNSRWLLTNTLTNDLRAYGILYASTNARAITNSSGKIPSTALETVGVDQGGVGQASSGWTGLVKVTAGTWATATAGTDYPGLAAANTFSCANIFSSNLSLDGGTTVTGTLTVSSAATFTGKTTIGSTGSGNYARLVCNAVAPTSADWSGISIGGKVTEVAMATYHSAVYMNASGKWNLANATVSGGFPARGLAVTSGSSGAVTTVLVSGIACSTAWNWTTLGAPLYLSSVDGGLTQSPTTAAGNCIQQVGFAVASSVAFVNFTGHWLVCS